MATTKAASAAPSVVTAPPAAPADPNACGGFEKRALTKKTSLLQDRLFITPIAGLEPLERPRDIMSAAASAEHETRLFLQDGEHKLVVFSEELFARSSPTLVKDVQGGSPQLQDVPGEERTLPSGLRAAVFIEPKLDAPNDAVPVAHTVTVLPDDTVQVTHVFVTPSVVSAGSAGCRALALKLLDSLEPGPRRLDLSGGKRTLEPGYTLELPASYALMKQPGPDFTVFVLMPVIPLGKPAGRLGLYFGHHPDFEANPAAQLIRAKILGKSVDWLRTKEGDEVGQEVLVNEPDGLAIHLFLGAPNEAVADDLARVASGLKRGK